MRVIFPEENSKIQFDILAREGSLEAIFSLCSTGIVFANSRWDHLQTRKCRSVPLQLPWNCACNSFLCMKFSTHPKSDREWKGLVVIYRPSSFHQKMMHQTHLCSTWISFWQTHEGKVPSPHVARGTKQDIIGLSSPKDTIHEARHLAIHLEWTLSAFHMYPSTKNATNDGCLKWQKERRKSHHLPIIKSKSCNFWRNYSWHHFVRIWKLHFPTEGSHPVVAIWFLLESRKAKLLSKSKVHPE